ncbi:MAG: hypothetical protein ACLQOO_04470 [Terriglobia bacterium]
MYRTRYRIDVIGASGKIERRKRESITLGKISKREARRKRDEFLARHGIGDTPKAEMAFTDFWDLHYWRNAAEGKKDISTQKFYTGMFKNRIEPAFGDGLCATSRGS